MLQSPTADKGASAAATNSEGNKQSSTANKSQDQVWGKSIIWHLHELPLFASLTPLNTSFIEEMVIKSMEMGIPTDEANDGLISVESEASYNACVDLLLEPFIHNLQLIE